MFALSGVVDARSVEARSDLARGDLARSDGASADGASSRTLILISIDGFRWDYPELHGAPNLIELGREGLRAEALVPNFPTKTFPNHYTIITGLWPEHHGIVGNDMFDPELDAVFQLGNPGSMSDTRWWGGEPLWITAERQGVRAATMFWPGSEFEIAGQRPSKWLPYKGSLPDEERVDQVLAWLDLPADERPGFITLYFSCVDTAGHLYGPKSREVRAAVGEVDRSLGRLIEGLERRELTDSVNLVIVSDHGMAELHHERVIVLEDHVELEREEVVSLSPLVGIWTERIPAADLAKTLDAVPHLRAWQRSDLPERFHWKNHRRIPPVVALADDGWRVVRRSGLESFLKGRPGGGHGFDNESPSMRGIFFARGPSFGQGLRVPAFENIHVYVLLATALGLEPAKGDGDLSIVKLLLNTGKR